MINLRNDYSQIAHPKILQALTDHCLEDNEGYGLDKHSKKAEQKIKELLACSDCDVHFLMNGTGTNKAVLAHILRPYQAVISCDTGHIYVHETGAIESSGHKVIACDCKDGKLDPTTIEEVCAYHSDEHMVMPKAVYISDATETGTIYSFNELKALRKVCDRLGLYLYMDGARLAVAMQCTQNDVKWVDLCGFFDAFCIGGTKNGALLGEAVVITNDVLKKDFRYSIKNSGAMYAKGFVAGIEFCELLQDDLYMDLAKNANEMADIIKKGILGAGLMMEYPSVTNQLFVIVTKEQARKLAEDIIFETIFSKPDGNIVIRFVTSFATKRQEALEVVKILEALNK